jgi:hypothetical protein
MISVREYLEFPYGVESCQDNSRSVILCGRGRRSASGKLTKRPKRGPEDSGGQTSGRLGADLDRIRGPSYQLIGFNPTERGLHRRMVDEFARQPDFACINATASHGLKSCNDGQDSEDVLHDGYPTRLGFADSGLSQRGHTRARGCPLELAAIPLAQSSRRLIGGL